MKKISQDEIQPVKKRTIESNPIVPCVFILLTVIPLLFPIV